MKKMFQYEQTLTDVTNARNIMVEMRGSCVVKVLFYDGSDIEFNLKSIENAEQAERLMTSIVTFLDSNSRSVLNLITKAKAISVSYN